MPINSKKLLLRTLICGTFITTNMLIASDNVFAATADDKDKTSPVNQQLLAPNEAVNSMTDMERTRRYYDSRKGENINKIEDNQDVKEADTKEIKLPPRTKKNALSVHIYRVEMDKSEIFSKSEIDKFISLLQGKDVTDEDINNFVNLINAQYLKKGVITARAYVTEGKINDGVLKIELMEARIGKLSVDGNKYNKEWYLRSQFSRKDGDVFSLSDLQKELKTFNRNARSIKMRAELKPGEEYGTTDVKLHAEETMPYHISASFDNFGRDTTGEHRGGLIASTDSLIGFQDRLSVAANVARSSFNPYIDYSIPVNRYGTRAGVSYMYGKSKVTSGEYKDFDLNAKTNTYSTYVSHPLIDKARGKLNFNTSLNKKTSTSKIAGFKYADYKDYNLAVGFGGNYNFSGSAFYGSLYSTNGVIKDEIRNERKKFTKVNADGYYIHYLPWGIIGTLKAGGQYSPDNISYVEQYQIGGISSVRGYSESLLMAPSAYYTSLEMLFPIPFLPETVDVPFTDDKQFRLKDSVKFAAFVDHGGIFPHEGKSDRINYLLSDGVGLRMAFNKYLSARFYVGFPLMNKGTYHESDTNFHFDLIAAPF